MPDPRPAAPILAFDRFGDSAAPALVLLHGLSGARTTWAPIVEALQPRIAAGSLQVLPVDLRGHGGSGRAATVQDYHAHAYAADVAALIERLGLGAAVVVGHSLGGVTAAALATARPDLVRAALLEDPPHFEGDAAVRNASPVAAFFPRLVAAVRELQATGAPAEAYRPLVAPISDPLDVDERCEALRRWDPTTMQAAIDGVVWQGFDPVATLGCPLTIVAADPAAGAVFKPADAERVVAANPHARVVTVAGATHQVHGPATRSAFVAELDRFLDEVVGTP